MVGPRPRSGRSTARTRLTTAPPVYPGTMSGYGSTRLDSVGETVPTYAYSAAQQAKAFNAKSPQILSKVQAATPSE